MERVLAGKFLIESVRHMILSWPARSLLMMERKACSLLVLFLVINMSSLLFLKMLRRVGMDGICSFPAVTILQVLFCLFTLVSRCIQEQCEFQQ